MIAYWERDCEWMGEGLQLAICPSFTGPTGLAALDVSGRSNHGTLTNMDRNTAWQTSGGKGALSFDGSNDHVLLSGASAGTIPASLRVGATGNAGTWSVWVYRTATGGAAYFGENLFYCFNFTSTGATAGVWGFDVSLSGLALSRWDFITTTFDGTGRVTGFVNGIQNATATGTSVAKYANAFNLAIGARIQTASYVTGQIDDFRVYNRALTAQEVRQLYERGRGGGMLHQPVNQRSYYAQLAAAFSILAESGSYALNGHPIPLLYGRAISADTGSVLLSGQTTSLLTSRLLNADQGSYAYTGTDAATLLGRLLDAGAAAYTLDGNAAGFLASRRISADTVAYLASGLDAGFLRSRVLEAGTGQYVLVASPVNLQTGTGGAAPYYYLFLLGGSR